MFFNEGTIDSEKAEERYPIFFGYVTEYSKAAIGSMVKHYLVVAIVDGAPQGDGINFLLRNHIYRYEINAVGSSEANIIDVGYTVCNWDNYTVDIPTFN